MFALSNFLPEFRGVPSERDAVSYQANKSAVISFHTLIQHSAQQALSGISSPLIEAVERFGVMKCRSTGQSLIHGDEQESKSSVTFPLTLNTPFQFTQ